MGPKCCLKWAAADQLEGQYFQFHHNTLHTGHFWWWSQEDELKTHTDQWVYSSDRFICHRIRRKFRCREMELLCIFNGQSIELTGFNGWSIVLTGCNQNQSSASRKQLDRHHTALVVTFFLMVMCQPVQVAYYSLHIVSKMHHNEKYSSVYECVNKWLNVDLQFEALVVNMIRRAQ